MSTTSVLNLHRREHERVVATLLAAPLIHRTPTA